MNEKAKKIVELENRFESMTDMQLLTLFGKSENDGLLMTVLTKRGYDYNTSKEVWTANLYDVWKIVTSYVDVDSSYMEIYGEDTNKMPVEKNFLIASRLSLKDTKELIEALQAAESDENVSYDYTTNWINGLHNGDDIVRAVEDMSNTIDVKELRQATGMSQSKLAEYFGIPVRTLQDWEQGKRTPPEYVPKMMQRIIKAESTSQ